jgi:hypothetical protein
VDDVTFPDRSAVLTWVATALVVGALVAGAVGVERLLIRAWEEMRKDIHPLAPAAARIQRTKDTYRRRLDNTTDATQVIRDLSRMAPRSR